MAAGKSDRGHSSLFLLGSSLFPGHSGAVSKGQLRLMITYTMGYFLSHKEGYSICKKVDAIIDNHMKEFESFSGGQSYIFSSSMPLAALPFLPLMASLASFSKSLLLRAFLAWPGQRCILVRSLGTGGTRVWQCPIL